MKSSRDLRQEESVNKWIEKKGIGSIVAATGFGKTRIAFLILKKYVLKYPERKVLIVVPSRPLSQQWKDLLIKEKLQECCTVEVINTVIKYQWDQEFLIIDEVHRMAAVEFRKVFSKVSYKQILCLTATLKRLDGLDFIIEHYAPVCDEIPLKLCLTNGWISPYREYKVLLDVDLQGYQNINKEFVKHFSFFDFDFDLAMSCVKSISRQILLSKQKNLPLKVVKASTYSFARSMKMRRQWVLNHPKKIEIVERIIENRKDKKILTFFSSIDTVKQLKDGYVVHSKMSSKKVQHVITEFMNVEKGVLHSVDSLRDGADIPGVSIAILVGYNRSTLRKIQTIGRVVRKEENKEAEIFTLVIKDTVEEEWFRQSTKGQDYITVDTEDLNTILGNNHVVKKDNIYFD